jgi:signal peptidase II
VTVGLAGLTASAVLILDQVAKAIALKRLEMGVPVPVVDGLFSLTLVMNPGLAFGMLSSTPEGWRWVVAALSVAALGVLGWIGMRMVAAAGRWAHVALGLVFGGAVGNLIDRARFGAVVDFLDFYWQTWHWPAFNVADSAISVGVALLALHMLLAPAPSRS